MQNHIRLRLDRPTGCKHCMEHKLRISSGPRTERLVLQPDTPVCEGDAATFVTFRVRSNAPALRLSKRTVRWKQNGPLEVDYLHRAARLSPGNLLSGPAYFPPLMQPQGVLQTGR